MSDSDRIFEYSCLNCLTKRQIKYKDPIKCLDCGNRILRKLRTKNPVQLEAR